MTLPVLWHFRISHYNEKARWALDYKGVPHVRRALLPGLHVPRALWLTGQKAVPVLVLDDQAIVDSTRIIAALERHTPTPPLYPAHEEDRRRALALEDFFDEQLGPHVRRWLFHAVLPYAGLAAATLSSGSGTATRGLYRALFPAIRMVMKFDMGIDDGSAERSRAKVLAALDRLEAEVQPSGYLVGERFSVADLTAAALFVPLVMPAEFPYSLPSLPEPAASFRASLAARPGFRWVATMYRQHRGVSQERAA